MCDAVLYGVETQDFQKKYSYIIIFLRLRIQRNPRWHIPEDSWHLWSPLCTLFHYSSYPHCYQIPSSWYQSFLGVKQAKRKHTAGCMYVYYRRRGLEHVWNVMAHAQKPDLVFRRKGRVHLNRRGRQFSRLLAAEVCASAVVMVVMLDTPCSEVECKTTGYPLHFP